MSELGPAIRALGASAAAELRRRDLRACARSAWLGAGPLLVAAPLALLGAAWGLRALGVESGPRGFAALAGVSFGFGLAYTLARTLRLRDRTLGVGDGLARLDRELASEGRLQAAHEFLAHAERTPFMQAAVEDSAAIAARARAHRLADDPRDPLPRRAWLAPAASLALCALAAWLAPRPSSAPGADGRVELAAAPSGDGARRSREESPGRATPPPARTPEGQPKPREQGAPSNGEERPASSEPERQARESTGKTGEGRSAQATPTSSSSESRGFMSSQSPPSEPGEAGKPNPKKSKKAAQKEPEAAPRKKLDEPSGSTAGKGTGSGSSKNPGSTDWQSKDQVSSDEETPLEHEEDVDDESDESEARGGLQPSLRDRRPSVNRDLTIGFGNQKPPPDANGRGGPSDQKKSRGVAALVLGVPLPDHVKGQPNPGRTKITQERVEPRSEDAAPIEAAARTPRAQPIGALNRRELEPWMREIVRGYFLKLRTKSESQP